MAMFNTTQVPIQEPMYINGQLSQVWLMFFLRLSQVVAVDNQVDLTDTTQLVHQLATQATQGQMLIDLASLRDQCLPLVNTHITHQAFTQPIDLPTSEVLHDSV